MRKIVAGLSMSLDGVVEAPETWFGPYVSDEVGQTIGSLIAAGDALLLGRMTYQIFARDFGAGTSGDPMAAQMNSIPKLVVSTTLNAVEWQNSTLISGDVAEAIAELKQQPGRTINISGSGTLVTWLLGHDLLDELDLLVSPVIVGSGKRLCQGGQIPLKLAAVKPFANGVLHLAYQRAGA